MNRERIEANPRLSPLSCFLNNDDAGAAADMFVQELYVAGRSNLELRCAFDASEADDNEIRQWFVSLNLPNQSVMVVWLSAREGVILPLHIFFESFNAFWQPSTDDVVVSDPAQEHLLLLDHEENFSLFTRKK